MSEYETKSGLTVIKIGGSLARDNAAGEIQRKVMEDVADLHNDGIPLVVVHGGGKDADDVLEAAGLTSKWHRGKRVTDVDTLEVVDGVFMGVNARIVEQLGESGVPAVSLTMPKVIEATQTTEQELGLVGDVTSVDAQKIMTVINKGAIPVIPPITREQGGTRLFNSNADTVAGAVSSQLNAARLVFATDTRGVRGHCTRILTELKPGLYYESLREDNMLRGGMLPKVEAGFKAAGTGVDVTICSFADLGRAARGQSRVGTKLKAA